MAYNRQPNVVLAGQGLKQNPLPSTTAPSGVVPVQLDAEVATTTQLGIIQVGSGLAITPLGVLSAQNSGLVNVKLTGVNYTALATDYYIGATTAGITVTLPPGVVGKTYVVKNQVNGNITVTGTGGQKLDTANTKQLGTNDSVTVIFDGVRWNIVTS
jgi:hypothetical protein